MIIIQIHTGMILIPGILEQVSIWVITGGDHPSHSATIRGTWIHITDGDLAVAMVTAWAMAVSGTDTHTVTGMVLTTDNTTIAMIIIHSIMAIVVRLEAPEAWHAPKIKHLVKDMKHV